MLAGRFTAHHAALIRATSPSPFEPRLICLPELPQPPADGRRVSTAVDMEGAHLGRWRSPCCWIADAEVEEKPPAM